MSGSLLRAEVHRFRSRRFIVVLLLVGIAVFGVGVAIASTHFSKTSPSSLAEARAELSRTVKEQEAFRQQCLATVPKDVDPAQACGDPFTEDSLDVTSFVKKPPFVLAREAPDGSTAIGVITAAVLFLVGATWVGAEWSTRSMVALLFWEPRRMKVVTTKLAVLSGAAAAVAALAQLLWFGAAQLLAATRGTRSVPDGFYGDLAASGGRAVVVGVLVAALGFSLANLVRNTGAALGVAFFWFVVAENVVRVVRPHWTDLLISSNVAALLSKDGFRYYEQGRTIDARGVLQPGHEVVLSHLHGATVMGVLTAAMVGLGIWLFQRRDLH